MFQSTHPRRVWLIGFIKPHEIQRFQSTHPRRVWLWWCVMAHHVFEFQSTHPRRVWLIGFIKPHEIQRFQSTHPRRVWLWWCVMAHHVFEFQSTHPRRVWLYIQLCLWLWIRFNPHTHAGCDGASQTDSKCKTVSIHTPTQGVTLYLITYYKSANLIHCYANHHYYSTS